MMHVYESLVDALEDLKARGFTTDFKLNFDTIECTRAGVNLSPAHFEIVEYYRFEADTSPDESSVLYAIQSIDEK